MHQYFSVMQENLVWAIQALTKVIESNPKLPALGHIYFRAEGSRITMQATNLETTMTVYISGKVDLPIEFCLPAATLSSLVPMLSKERVDFMYDPKVATARIHCGSTNTNIKGLDPQYFPYKESDNFTKVTTMPTALLKRMLLLVIPEMADNDNRPILMAVHLEFMKKPGDKLIAVTADGFRLGVVQAALDSLESELEVNVNKVASNALQKTLPDEGAVVISQDPKGDSLKFSYNNVDVVAGLVDGKYPDFRAIIPRKSSFEAIVDRKSLEAAVRNALIFSRDSADSVLFKIDTNTNRVQNAEGAMVVTGTCEIIGRSAERGDTHNLLEITGTGVTIVSLNAGFVLAAIKNMNTEDVIIRQNGLETPVVIVPANAGEILIDETHIVMPMSKPT